MLENPITDHYGFALAEATSFPSGTIYPILARLETAGWVTSFWEQEDPAELERPRRRMYRLTGAGAHAAREALVKTQRLVGTLSLANQPQAGTTWHHYELRQNRFNGSVAANQVDADVREGVTMHEFTCGHQECNSQFTSRDKATLMKQVADHVRDKHDVQTATQTILGYLEATCVTTTEDR
jgi:DNA-binding PadR family transcriptional regulator/predicted small metal-binding protein